MLPRRNKKSFVPVLSFKKRNYISSSQNLMCLKVTNCIMTSATTQHRKKSFNSSIRPLWFAKRLSEARRHVSNSANVCKKENGKEQSV